MSQQETNAARIARSVADGNAADLRKAAEKKAAPRRRAVAAPKPLPRRKVVWAVGRPGIAPLKVYPYVERPDADAEAKRRGGDYRVVALKVPME